MPIQTTTNKGFQKPQANNTLAADIVTLRTQVDQIDAAFAGQDAAINSKVAASALANYQTVAQKNAASGYAGLDASGKVPSILLPAVVSESLRFAGTWNASSNTPAMPALAQTHKGKYWRVTVAGATALSGINDWKIGDYVVCEGNAWSRIDNSDAVTSVAGRTGDVTLTKADIANLVTDLDAITAALGLKANFTANTFTGIQKISPAAGNSAALELNKPTGGFANYLIGKMNNLTRWFVALGDAGVESGGNTGSNFAIGRYSDAGTFIDFPVSINRATGKTTATSLDAATLTLGGLPVEVRSKNAGGIGQIITVAQTASYITPPGANEWFYALSFYSPSGTCFANISGITGSGVVLFTAGGGGNVVRGYVKWVS